MKIKDIFLTSITSLILMAYGWYLGQLHQSGYDVAGIFLFFTGITGLVLAFLYAGEAKIIPGTIPGMPTY